MAISAVNAIGYTNATDTSSDQTDGTSGSGSSGSSGSSAPVNPAGLLDREAFLKLLVAQLRYQDPTKPLDPTEMVSQSAQLTVVDKLNEISTALSQSSSIDRLALAGSVIGKDITFASPDGYPVTEQVTSIRFDGTSLVLRTPTYEVALESVQVITEHAAGSPAGDTA